MDLSVDSSERHCAGVGGFGFRQIHCSPSEGKDTSDPIPPYCYLGEAIMTSPLPTFRNLAAPRPIQK